MSNHSLSGCPDDQIPSLGEISEASSFKLPTTEFSVVRQFQIWHDLVAASIQVALDSAQNRQNCEYDDNEQPLHRLESEHGAIIAGSRQA